MTKSIKIFLFIIAAMIAFVGSGYAESNNSPFIYLGISHPEYGRLYALPKCNVKDYQKVCKPVIVRKAKLLKSYLTNGYLNTGRSIETYSKDSGFSETLSEDVYMPQGVIFHPRVKKT